MAIDADRLAKEAEGKEQGNDEEAAAAAAEQHQREVEGKEAAARECL
jgi:hypothetical protein